MDQTGISESAASSEEMDFGVAGPDSTEANPQDSEERICQDLQPETGAEKPPSFGSPLISSSTPIGERQLAISGPLRSPAPLEQYRQRLRKELQVKK